MIQAALLFLVKLVEGVGALIILVAVGVAAAQLIAALAKGTLSEKVTGSRLRLGQGLVLALEFLIAADILRTIITPKLEELLALGGIIIIRTVLSLGIAFELQRSSRPKDALSSEVAPTASVELRNPH